MGASGPLKPSDGKLRATDSVMDATGEIAVAADTGDQLGESPVWDRAGNCLWWIDLRRPALHRLEGGTVATMDLPALVGAVVPGGDGRTAWVALPDGWWIVRGTGMRRAFAFPDHGPGYRLNDAKCGADGTLWFGSMRDRGADETGGLWSLSWDGLRQHRGGIRIPNALAVSPGGRLAFCDTVSGGIETARLEAGGLADWRLLAPADIAPGKPDGSTFDSEGYLWNARYGGGCLARIAPDGRLDRLVELPVSRPTSCAFGGPDMATLYVTTARQGLTEAELRAQPLAGATLCLRPGVTGIPDTPFHAGPR